MSAPCSVVLITKNAEKTLPVCLQSVQALAAEIILVDSDSTDRTLEIAQIYGARIHKKTMLGFGEQKQFALYQAQHNWVFLIDADEAMEPALLQEIQATLSGETAHAAYSVGRKNFYFGRWLKHGGKYPDRQTRLLNKTQCHFSDDLVHEKVLFSGSLGHLRHDLLHYTYPDMDTWLHKLRLFAQFRAQDLVQKNLRPGFWLGFKYLVYRPKTRFLRRYILRLGFLDGLGGFLACLHDALTEIIGYIYFLEQLRRVK